MLAKTLSIALVGAEAHLVEVEVHSTQGVPSFTVVGLPAKSVREAEQRTRSALLSSDQRWPPSRTLANLAPASLRKEGTHFDLPIAVGILAADGRLEASAIDRWLFVGELGLDGSVRPIRGTLPAAVHAARAELRGIVCPAANAVEGALIEGLQVVPVATLSECIGFLRGQWRPPRVIVPPEGVLSPGEDMADVRGQHLARKALEAAAAGGHNLLMRGSPGCGKTMLARRLPGILPRMSSREALDVTKLHSIAGLLSADAGLIQQRPFRAPHPGVSPAGLIGGGPGLARPGEIALANHGVLFLDELPMFRREVIESLRGPLEDGMVRIVRSGGAVSFSCRFSLVAAMNPCPCGFLEDPARACRCTGRQLSCYYARISRAVLDRFDIQLGMTRVTSDDLIASGEAEPSSAVRERVEAARASQRERFSHPYATNASVSKRELLKNGCFAQDCFGDVQAQVDAGTLTGRGFERVLRLARTIADLEGSARVTSAHVGTALVMRSEGTSEEVAA